MNDGPGVEFRTSGSTGLAKTVVKTASSLDADAEMLLKSFPDLFGGTPYVLSTIREEHMFGALWRVRLPILAGCGVFPSVIVSVEELVAAADGRSRTLLVTTPSFLENAVRREEFAELGKSLVGIVTSGSLLRSELSKRVKEATGVAPTEIFGSTETGSVAWRRQGDQTDWMLFDGVEAHSTEDGLIGVDSAFCVERPYTMGDRVKFVSERVFRLLGRADRNVKILEKYVSLPRLEDAMERHPLIAKVHAVASDEPIARIRAIVELTASGKAELKRTSYAGLTARLKREISGVESFAFPRRIRFLNDFPYNEQGKLPRAAVASILASRYQEPVVENEVSLPDGFAADLTFISDAIYFDGHFKEFKILPGVVQLCFIESRIRNRWKTPPFSGEVARLKFQRPVRPGEKVRLEVKRADNDRFQFSVKCSEECCTSGVFVFSGESATGKRPFAGLAMLLISCVSMFASADALPDAFEDALRRALDADAVWSMTKTVEGSPLKLKSKGSVSCTKGHGIVWRTESPISSSISMEPGSMTFVSESERRTVPASEMPYYRDIRRAVDGFLEGADAPLEDLFDVSSENSPPHWSVKLTPKRRDMAMLVKSVSVSGASTVDKVVFHYASGETVEMDFKETARSALPSRKGRP